MQVKKKRNFNLILVDFGWFWLILIDFGISINPVNFALLPIFYFWSLLRGVFFFE